MVQISLATKTGGQVVLDAPAAHGGPSSFAFALNKAGSVLLNQLVSDLAKAAGRPSLNVPSALFMAGEGDDGIDQRDLTALFSEPGYVFTGFRNYGSYLEPIDLSVNPKLLLVRDPRDILVSFYFSVARSHALPNGGPGREELLRRRAFAAASDIDTYLLSDQCDKIRRNYDGIIDKLLVQRNLTVYRYEDVIFRKRWWVADICRRLELRVGFKKRWKIARKHDVRPEKEKPDQHIRQVRPGNFRRHLRPETIREIERRYAAPMECFGYRPFNSCRPNSAARHPITRPSTPFFL